MTQRYCAALQQQCGHMSICQQSMMELLHKQQFLGPLAEAVKVKRVSFHPVAEQLLEIQDALEETYDPVALDGHIAELATIHESVLGGKLSTNQRRAWKSEAQRIAGETSVDPLIPDAQRSVLQQDLLTNMQDAENCMHISQRYGLVLASWVQDVKLTISDGARRMFDARLRQYEKAFKLVQQLDRIEINIERQLLMAEPGVSVLNHRALMCEIRLNNQAERRAAFKEELNVMKQPLSLSELYYVDERITARLNATMQYVDHARGCLAEEKARDRPLMRFAIREWDQALTRLEETINPPQQRHVG